MCPPNGSSDTNRCMTACCANTAVSYTQQVVTHLHMSFQRMCQCISPRAGWSNAWYALTYTATVPFPTRTLLPRRPLLVILAPNFLVISHNHSKSYTPASEAEPIHAKVVNVDYACPPALLNPLTGYVIPNTPCFFSLVHPSVSLLLPCPPIGDYGRRPIHPPSFIVVETLHLHDWMVVQTKFR
jgi:hypothetical protein